LNVEGEEEEGGGRVVVGMMIRNERGVGTRVDYWWKMVVVMVMGV